jgi:RNA polymerase sigma factor (TIGR02999 family)
VSPTSPDDGAPTLGTLPEAPALAADDTVTPEVKALADELLPAFYAELKRLARRERSRVGAATTLQTTALVHEAYLKLRGAKGWNDDTHFLRAAALAMRHALLTYAKARLTAKRGGGAKHVSHDEQLTVEPATPDHDETLLALNQALERLAGTSPRLARVVECRFFAGYDERETARALALSERTVRRDWALARAWLHRELQGGAPPA